MSTLTDIPKTLHRDVRRAIPFRTISLFDFNSNDIRVIDIDGTAWFPVKDVCDALGITNSRAAYSQIPDHQRQQVLKSSVANPDVNFPNRGMQCVSEGGLYKLLFLSRKPAALDFQDRVTDTVLPSIHKHGGYIAGQEHMTETTELLRESQKLQEKLASALGETTAALNKSQEENTSMREVLEWTSLQRWKGVRTLLLQ